MAEAPGACLMALKAMGRPGRLHAIGVMIAARQRRMMSQERARKAGRGSMPGRSGLTGHGVPVGLLPGSVEEVDRMAVRGSGIRSWMNAEPKNAVRSGWLAAREGI